MKCDGSEESGDDSYGFFFNNGIEDIDGKCVWQRQPEARRRLREYGVTSSVDGKSNLIERPTCLQKLQQSVGCDSTSRVPAPFLIYLEYFQAGPCRC